MNNVKYNRFRNTLSLLKNCQQHMGDSDISAAEMDARKEMVAVCGQIVALDEEYEEE